MDKLVLLKDVENIIISAIEKSKEGEQDPVWNPIYKALDLLRNNNQERKV